MPTDVPVSGPGPDRAARARCLRWTAGLAALFAVLLVTVVTVGGRTVPLPPDATVDSALHTAALGHPGWTRLALVLTDWVWGPTTMRALTVVAAGVCWLTGRRRQAYWAVTAAVLGWTVETAVKAAVDRARPHWPHPVDTATGAAFPSGHALAATTACLTLSWLLRLSGRRGRWWALAVVVGAGSVAGVGVTRVYLGVHWPSDVIGGWLAGAAVVTATAAFCAPWRRDGTPHGR
ncbi:MULTISPECIES: phosphatase PAP2 family protein [Streptomycetaceae]|uniref:Putative integral membrane protein n=1 Tax=Streptantibioticus cattleyicolor (strain ATCC 35852 / DSM 46488 / JCM 4925 / NBRC 14057 / NRRL 8057) TaxID=1003195 RepID=F8JW41_STREN|nr:MULTISPECIES: phosphatase PAP2 family protein [Streptomycetaceae]AEW93209.1 putative integral membrane protein [Streptantibioticus cattleyicolor NRRL 8057 = DSM 46488]MYS57933.1 phosphatase PAP2 family protein [Streptomyces sp. SID5468]CCB73572.1 conserved membrane protein of unknown function [Streptantibioticus cattleyicolor NRRL 8057 = DSM 46488]